MSGSQKFFRNLSRTNAVLLFLALSALVVTLVVVLVQEASKPRHVAESDKTVASVDEEDTTLRLEQGTVASDTGVVKIDLIASTETKGIGSGGSSRETRNILFVPADGSAAHWLLPDNKSRIVDSTDAFDLPPREDAKTIATAAIIRPADATDEIPGRILLFDASGMHVTEIAKAATTIDLAAMTKTELVVVYRNGEKFFRATFDPTTLAKRTESAIQVPKLK